MPQSQPPLQSSTREARLINRKAASQTPQPNSQSKKNLVNSINEENISTQTPLTSPIQTVKKSSSSATLSNNNSISNTTTKNNQSPSPVLTRKSSFSKKPPTKSNSSSSLLSDANLSSSNSFTTTKPSPLRRSGSYNLNSSSISSHNNMKRPSSSENEKRLSRPKGSAFQKKRPLDDKSISYKLMEEVVNSSIINTQSSTMNKQDGIVSHRDLRMIITKKIALIKSIHDNIIGCEAVFRTPFGVKKYLPITCCDSIASSGKPLKMIEDYINEQVLPTFTSSQTTTSFTGLQMAQLIEDARNSIAQSVNANLRKKQQAAISASKGGESVDSNSQSGLNEDVILFTGDGGGSTDSLESLLNCIGIKQRVRQAQSERELPVVLISTLEHPSTVRAWTETGACVFQIMEDKFGRIDLDELQVHLKQFKDSGRMVMVSMSAASHVTGVYTDTDAIAKVAHENNAWCFFDYAEGAPYLNVDVNPNNNDPLLSKDAVFISPHKFVGGPSTPGVLIAKKKIFSSNYADIEEKEGERTSNITGIIRCALVFKLKDEVGQKLIQKIEEKYRDRALKTWSTNPNLILLGPGSNCIGEDKVGKLAFFSFLIKHNDYYLHPSFVSLLLNDLFGIQSRPGAHSRDGPYGVELLGIHETKINLIQASIADAGKSSLNLSCLEPGWSSLNLNYFFDDNTVNFVLKAVDFVATYGWKLLPYYVFDAKTNEWTHRRFGNSSLMRLSGFFDNFTKYTEQHRKRLTDVSFSNGFLEFVDKNGELHNVDPTTPLSYASILKEAESVLRESTNNFGALYINIDNELNNIFGDEELGLRQRYGNLRWFVLPSEALMDMKGIEREKHTDPVIRPKVYPSSDTYIKQKKIESRTHLKSILNK